MTRGWRTWTVALGVLAAALGGPTSPVGAQQPLDDLDAFVRRAMAEWNVPGVSVAVVHGDSVVFADGWGVRSLDDGGEVTEHTLFGVMSTTKAFTSTAIAMLVAEGRIDWEDRVHDLLPDFVMPDPWVTREFTVRDLLSHRSGLERGDFLWFGSGFSRDEIVRRLRHLDEAGPFRATYGYSNNMYITAGEMLEAVTGTTWDRFVDERIFTPLGMHASNTSVDDLVDAGNVAAPHEELGGTLTAIPYRSLDNEAPGGSINSSALDMAQWLRFQLGRGVFEGDTLVAPSALLETRTPQTPIPFGDGARTTNPGMDFQFYAMGWTVQDYRGTVLVQHSGGIDGLRSRVAMLPEHDLGLVVLTNKGSYNSLHDVVRNHILDAWLGESGTDWSRAFLEGVDEARAAEAGYLRERAAARVAGTSPSRPLDAYAGAYRSDAYGDARILVEDGHLVARFGPSIAGDLEHWHHDTFLATWRNPYLGTSLVTFDLGPDGAPVRVRTEHDWWPVYTRVPSGPGS